MSTRSVLAWSAVLVALAAILARDRFFFFFSADPVCRTILSDAAWPNITAWNNLNETVGGKLIATVPIAAPCHKTLNGAPNDLYDEERCAVLRDTWFLPETHLESPSSPMSYLFSNDTCNPWLGPDTRCTTGTDAVYVINATEVSDIVEGVRFATENNIRLVIRNTGHDYLGKSTGAHSMSIWMHSFKSMDLQVRRITQPGGGWGNCPTVALAGGFIQGGGHGPLASRYGLAADTVLEMEVVTPTGEFVIASPKENTDLFWALRGGGGGTFGVVTSATVKAFPDTYGSTASMMVANTGTNADALYSAIGGFIQKALPGLVDAGAFVVWIAAPFGFMISPAVAPGLTSTELDKLMQPMVDILKGAGLEYQYASAQHKTFLDSFESYSQATSWNVSDYNVGGRLIPRSLALERTDELVGAIRHISTTAFMSGVSYNVARGVAAAGDVAVHPYFRETLFGLALGTPVNYTDWGATLAGQGRITHDLIPTLERLTPEGGAAYLNEANFEQGDFQRTMYGDHYERLLGIKRKYDPKSIMYARTAVGSEEWEERGDGRLCRAK
ncbi:FAD binding domain protein [Apiospora hydei]|uniref:FAD binding domain protein n=1 Tax=Apiospora hydei TaxID=1337664 RepID=A0ABR1VI69_9PEZI